MRVHSPYRCDYCLNLKGETNHWWLRQPDRQHFTLLRWDATLADMEGYEHICSESCAANALWKAMNTLCSESCAANALSKWMTQPRAHVPTPAAFQKGFL